MSTPYELRAVTGGGLVVRTAYSRDFRIDLPVTVGSSVLIILNPNGKINDAKIEVAGTSSSSSIELAPSAHAEGLYTAVLFIREESDIQDYLITVDSTVKTLSLRSENWGETLSRRFAKARQKIEYWWKIGSNELLLVQKIRYRPSGFLGFGWSLDPNGRLGLFIATERRSINSNGVRFDTSEYVDFATFDQPELWAESAGHYPIRFLGVGLRQRRRCKEAVRARQDLWNLNVSLKSMITDVEKRTRAINYLVAGIRGEVRFQRRHELVRSIVEFLLPAFCWLAAAGSTSALLVRSPALYGGDVQAAIVAIVIASFLMPMLTLFLLSHLVRLWRFIQSIIFIALVGFSAYLLLVQQGILSNFWHAAIIVGTTTVMTAELALFAQPYIIRLGNRFFASPAVLEEVVGVKLFRVAILAVRYSESLGDHGSLSRNRWPGRELVKRLEDVARASELLFKALAGFAENDATRILIRRRGEMVAATLREHSALVLLPGNDHVGVAISLRNASDAICRGEWGELAVREPETARAKISKIAQIIPRILIGTLCGVAALYTPLLEYLAPAGQVGALRVTLLVSGFFALFAPDAGKVRDAVIPTLRK